MMKTILMGSFMVTACLGLVLAGRMIWEMTCAGAVAADECQSSRRWTVWRVLWKTWFWITLVQIGAWACVPFWFVGP